MPRTLDAPIANADDLPIIAIDMPVIFEDEGQEEMGDSAPHTLAIQILHLAIEAHLSDRPELRVYSNLNLFYHPINRSAYASPDVMVVKPFQPLPESLSSYRIGEDGPVPLLALEVLSPRTAQQGDLTQKPRIYAQCGVPEYILVDPTGVYLEEQLLIRRLQPDESWADSQDADGGVTSTLGFRIIFDDDGKIRVVNSATGMRYVRPREAQAEVEARLKAEEEKRIAEERAGELEAEVARLKALLPPERKN
jgi:Uma2 family endonuclease